MSFRKPRKSRRDRPVIEDQRLEDRAMRDAVRAEEHASRVVHDAETSVAGSDRRHRHGRAREAMAEAERIVHQAGRTLEHAIAEGMRHQDRAMHHVEEAMERVINEAQRQATRAVKVAEYAVSRDQ